MSKIRAVEQIIEITKCYKIPNHQITQITKLPNCQIICSRLEKFHVYVFLMMCCSKGSKDKKVEPRMHVYSNTELVKYLTCACHA